MPHGPQTARIVLTPGERQALLRWARRGSTAQALALRARIVLACADRPDVSHGQLAAELGVHRATVGIWRRRFAARRLEGLQDDPRTGAPRRISDADVERAITTTLEHAPTSGTHWSTRGLAQAVGMSQTTVSRIWRGALHAYIAATNAEPKPFVWTKCADEILTSVRRFCQRTSLTALGTRPFSNGAQ